VKQHGVSLIESVIVIALIGILVTIAALNFRDMTIKSNIESQIKQMYSDLMTARIEAMDRTTYHFVTLNANRYTVTEDTVGNCTNSNCVYVAGAGNDPSPYQPAPMPNAILWNSGNGPATPSNVEIIFDNRGLVQVTTGTISITDTIGAAYDCIIIETTKINMGAMSGGTCVPK
jgi:prepilin-type N-terminal cleavage/methylation domain-containing protein